MIRGERTPVNMWKKYYPRKKNAYRVTKALENALGKKHFFRGTKGKNLQTSEKNLEQKLLSTTSEGVNLTGEQGKVPQLGKKRQNSRAPCLERQGKSFTRYDEKGKSYYRNTWKRNEYYNLKPENAEKGKRLLLNSLGGAS